MARPLLVATSLMAAAVLLPQTAAIGQGAPKGPVRLAGPEITDVLPGFALSRLAPPVPVLYPDSDPALYAGAREWQIALREARTFWRSLLGAAPDMGLLLLDSPLWTVTGLEEFYGFPGSVAYSRPDGRLALLAIEQETTFSEEAAKAARVAPIAYRGKLLAADLASAAGAARYAEAMVWVVFAEDMVGGLRIGSRSWWQARVVGAAAAWLFLESSRGRELAPGVVASLEGWGWFWREYLRPIAVGLSEAVQAPPGGDPRLRLELDARLIAFGRAIHRQYGRDAYVRFRRAWPHEAVYVNLKEALDALWAQMPELKAWETVLLEPRRK